MADNDSARKPGDERRALVVHGELRLSRPATLILYLTAMTVLCLVVGLVWWQLRR